MEKQLKRKAPGTRKVATAIQRHYDYETLAEGIRNHIINTYGSVTEFFNHEDFIKKCGFTKADKSSSSMFTYLSVPTGEEGPGKRKIVRSFPVISKLYRGLLGVELESKIKIERTQVITAENEEKLNKHLNGLLEVNTTSNANTWHNT